MSRAKVKPKLSGITLVEALIAIAITAIIAIGTAGLLTYFGIYTRKNIDMSCIVWAVSSTIEACRGGERRTKYYCSGAEIEVNLQGNCKPSSGTCSDIIASFKGFTLKDKVCNFSY